MTGLLGIFSNTLPATLVLEHGGVWQSFVSWFSHLAVVGVPLSVAPCGYHDTLACWWAKEEVDSKFLKPTVCIEKMKTESGAHIKFENCNPAVLKNIAACVNSDVCVFLIPLL